MAIIVLIVAALSLFFPKSVSFIKTSYVNYLLMIVMFGMGLTLKFEDFKVVFTRPKDIIIGAIIGNPPCLYFTPSVLLNFTMKSVFIQLLFLLYVKCHRVVYNVLILQKEM